MLESRRFHPWEGGEGKVLRQYTLARLHLGQQALENGDARTALDQFNHAMETPDNLGEKYHFLQAKADVLYWQGKAQRALGNEDAAIAAFTAAANESGDFQGMAVAAITELTIFKALALRELGRASEADGILSAVQSHAEREMESPAKIDYFATSLPNLLVFEEDLDKAKQSRAQALLTMAKEAQQ